MSGLHDWNPDDGPPPSEQEREEAAALRDALATHASTRTPGAPPPPHAPPDELLVMAARVHATARSPETSAVDAAVRFAIDHALAGRGASPGRGGLRWKLTAVAALILLGVGGARLLGPTAGPSPTARAISRDADDVFTEALGADPGSGPITRIDDARMRGYRQGLLDPGRVVR
jgi:hypothetical protein